MADPASQNSATAQASPAFSDHKAYSLVRHDLVWLSADFETALVAPLPETSLRIIKQRQAHNRPFVVARNNEDDPTGALRLGLAMPDKSRLCLRLNARAVEALAKPLPLATALPFLPDFVTPSLTALEAAFEAIACPLRVFGSASWQFFANRDEPPYFTHTSDVDLLITPTTHAQMDKALSILIAHDKTYLAPRLDGELILEGALGFTGGFAESMAISWRELAARPNKILLKNRHGAKLVVLKDILPQNESMPDRAAE